MQQKKTCLLKKKHKNPTLEFLAPYYSWPIFVHRTAGRTNASTCRSGSYAIVVAHWLT